MTMNDELRRMIAALLADGDPDARRRAAEGLSSSGGLASVSALAAALQDESKGVRDAAARSLLAIGGENVARAIVEYIASSNITTRNLAAELLVRIGPKTVPALLPFLKDPDRDVRKFAVDTFGLIGAPEPIPYMLPLLDDPDENVVVSAVEALGNMRAAGAIPYLQVAYERYPYARATVAEALGKIGESQASPFLLSRLEELMRPGAEDPVSLFAVIEALGAVADAWSLSALQRHVGMVKGKIRSMLLHALVQISERHHALIPAAPGLAEDFVRALRDDETPIRVSAAKWLVHAGREDLAPVLVGALGRAPEVDALLLEYLADRPGVFPAVLQALDAAAPAHRKTLIGLVARLTVNIIARIMRRDAPVYDEAWFSQAFEAIARMWDSADEETRSAIVDALFRLDGDRAVEFLDRIMNDPDPWLRMHVIEVIAAISDRRAPDFIARFLKDDDEMVREVAMSTLQSKGFVPDDATPEDLL
jgi:HEAT repeat protein